MEIKKGQKFESWVVLDNKAIKRIGKYYVYCKCTKCNETEKYLRISSLLNIKTKQCSKCYSTDKNRFKYFGFEEKERLYYSKVKSRAKKKKIPFKLSIKDMFDKIKTQNFKCYYSDLDINFYNKDSTITASLDRKDSSKGYTKSNINWVHTDINKMKNEYSEEYFLSLINQIIDNKKLSYAKYK